MSGSLTLRDITLRNAAAWIEHYLGCRQITVQGIHVHSFANGNNDATTRKRIPFSYTQGCVHLRLPNVPDWITRDIH